MITRLIRMIIRIIRIIRMIGMMMRRRNTSCELASNNRMTRVGGYEILPLQFMHVSEIHPTPT